MTTPLVTLEVNRNPVLACDQSDSQSDRNSAVMTVVNRVLGVTRGSSRGPAEAGPRCAVLGSVRDSAASPGRPLIGTAFAVPPTIPAAAGDPHRDRF